MKTTINAEKFLSAKALRVGDEMAILSHEGTSMENRVMPLGRVPQYLLNNGAFRPKVEVFIDELIATGFAKIQHPKLVSKLYC